MVAIKNSAHDESTLSSNMQRVIFNVVNFSKTKSLYRDGMSPLVKSTSRPVWFVAHRSFVCKKIMTMVLRSRFYFKPIFLHGCEIKSGKGRPRFGAMSQVPQLQFFCLYTKWSFVYQYLILL